MVKHFPHHRGPVVPGDLGLKGVVALGLERQHRRGHVVVLGVGHAGPVEGTGIHRAVGVVVQNGPRQQHALVHEVAEGVHRAGEVIAQVVGGLGGPSVSRTGVGRAATGVVAARREVRDHERVRVGAQVFPHHRRGVVPGPVDLEGVVAFCFHGQGGGGHVVELIGLHGGPVEGTGVHGAVVVVGVFDAPVEHHGLVGQGAVGVDGTREVLAEVVEVGVSVGVDAGFGSVFAAHWGGTAAAAAGEVVNHERGVARIHRVPHHGVVVVGGKGGFEGEVAFTLGGQSGGVDRMVTAEVRARPVVVARVHHGAGVVVHDGPVKAHGFIGVAAEVVDGAGEVVTNVVHALGAER